MECGGVRVWRHAKPPQSCWRVYFCKPCRLRLAITIMRKSPVACRAHLPGYRYACWHMPNPPSFCQVGGERAGTPCLSRRHHIGRCAGWNMFGHMTEPLAASMPRKHAWVQKLRVDPCEDTVRTPISPAEVLLTRGPLRGPRVGHSSACSSRAGDRWEHWHIPLTGDGNRTFLIWPWVQKEEEQAKKIKKKCALHNVSGVKPWWR